MSRERPLDPRYVKEKYGVDANVMKRLADYLRSAGDTSAVSSGGVSERPNAAPDFCTLYLRFALLKTGIDIGAFQTAWQSRGVCLQSTGLESEPVVLFTGDLKDLVRRPKEMVTAAKESPRSVIQGWIDLSTYHIYRRLYNDLFDQNEMKKEEFGLSIDKITIEEQVRLAMIFAKPRPDYRYGIGNTTGLESKVRVDLLNMAV